MRVWSAGWIPVVASRAARLHGRTGGLVFGLLVATLVGCTAHREVTILSDPLGAAVAVDGVPQGPTPITRVLVWPKKEEPIFVSVTKPGYESKALPIYYPEKTSKYFLALDRERAAIVVGGGGGGQQQAAQQTTAQQQGGQQAPQQGGQMMGPTVVVVPSTGAQPSPPPAPSAPPAPAPASHPSPTPQPGGEWPAVTRFCSSCGAKVQPSSKFCASCGAPVEPR